MSAATVRFVHELVERFPALKPLLTEHMKDNFGEVLPHLFMADVTRWVIAAFLADEWAQLVPLLSFLEHAYEKDGPVIEELISVSFLEHLPRPDEAGWKIRNLLGQELRDQLTVIG